MEKARRTETLLSWEPASPCRQEQAPAHSESQRGQQEAGLPPPTQWAHHCYQWLLTGTIKKLHLMNTNMRQELWTPCWPTILYDKSNWIYCDNPGRHFPYSALSWPLAVIHKLTLWLASVSRSCWHSAQLYHRMAVTRWVSECSWIELTVFWNVKYEL